uniref:Uncharacterized protein n=1 Tax=Heterorhabditis bacteriophora TaxID=37862 RepID=A0A1I7WI08_HETBA
MDVLKFAQSEEHQQVVAVPNQRRDDSEPPDVFPLLDLPLEIQALTLTKRHIITEWTGKWILSRFNFR